MNPEYIDNLLPNNPEPTLQFLSFLVVLSFLPLLILVTTPFLRIALVLSLTRQAIGTQTTPPTLVIIGLSLALTFFIMQPTFEQISQESVQPLAKKEITLGEAISVAYLPIKNRMLTQVEEKDLNFFYEASNKDFPETPEEVAFPQLVAAHIIGELRITFSLAFLIFIPFLVIDMIVANILLALGMQMLNPIIISLPFKLMIFVAVDGWKLIVQGLIKSFQ